jgi:hypothetical protein
MRLSGRKELFVWGLSCLIMPAIVLFYEFVLPYPGGGASMWPIAFVLGGFYGSIAGGAGVATASFYLKKKR